MERKNQRNRKIIKKKLLRAYRKGERKIGKKQGKGKVIKDFRIRKE